MASHIFGLALFCGTLFVGTLCQPAPQPAPVRICVPKSLLHDCTLMRDELEGRFICVSREDRFDCMRAVHEGDADVTKVDAQGVYVAGNFPLDVLAFEEADRKPYWYKGVALVKKTLELSSLSDLRGKRSCHTGVHRTVGWQIPVTRLQSEGIIPPNCESEMATVANFFNQSCAPHEWSPDPIVDAELKKKYPSLCALCQNPETCTRGDYYGGYEGSLRCLTEDRGDIAFSKTSAVEEFLNAHPDQRSELDFLCLNGDRIPVSEGVEAACSWGVRPTGAFVYSSNNQNEEDKQRIYSALHDAFSLYNPSLRPNANGQPAPWYTSVLVSNLRVTNIVLATEEQSNWRNYLGDFRLTIDRYFGQCQPRVMKFCTTSNEEQSKCSDLSKAAYARRSNVKLECVQQADRSSCIEKIKEGEADVITLDGGDVYRAGRYSGLVPVAAEIYGDDDAKYYAVAVVPESSDVSTLADLANKRSCHTGIGRTAGWIIPVSSLINAGLIPADQCDRALSLSQFFSASCAPGANDVRYNPNLSGVEKLCQQCIGDESGEHKCSRGSDERYSGYAGALRCLVQGDGDVAFVKHTTVLEYADGNSLDQWASDLRSSDYKLLCLNGGTAQVRDYRNCSLARVPSHYAMTSGTSTREKRLEVAEFLALVGKFLGQSSLNFNAFKEYQGKSDLLFKDSTTGLRATKLDSTYVDALGEQYYKAAESTDPQVCPQQ